MPVLADNSELAEARRLQQSGKLKQAEDLLRGLRLEGREALHRDVLLSAVLMLQGERSEGAAKIDLLLARDAAGDPHNSAFASDFALALYLDGRCELALHMAKIAVSLPAPDAAAFGRLGTFLLGKDEEAAARAYREAVLRDPGRAELHSNLARVLVSLESPEEALEHYERALRIMPDLEAAQRGRAAVLLTQERADELISRLEEEMGDDPEPKKRRRLARIMALDDRFQEAEGQLRQAIESAPEEMDIRLELLELLARQDRYPAVVRGAAHILDSDPQNLRALILGARAYIELGDSEKAGEMIEAAFEGGGRAPASLMARAELSASESDFDAAESDLRLALSVHPGSPPVLMQLGHVFMWTGRIEEAAECFERAARISPAALAALVSARKFPEDEAVLARMSRFAKDPMVPSEARSGMRFALANVYERMGDYDVAFEHLDSANALVSKTIKYDPDAFSKKAEITRRVFMPRIFERTRGMGVPDDRPLFICGMPRSGTTLTEQILASHSQVFGGGELPFLPVVTRRMQRVLKARKPFPLCMGLFGKRTALHAAAFYVKNILLLEGAGDEKYERIVDKLPHNFMHLGLISIILPEARIVHVRRDPRDVAVSNYFQNFKAKRGGMGYAFDLGHIGRQIADYLKMMQHWRDSDYVEFLDLDYEEMVSDPEANARRLVDYSGLDFDSRVLEHHKTERAVRTASVWQVRQPIYKSSTARWKRYEKHLGPLFEALDRHAPGWADPG
jgi:tetratricopeptide (TPR) repeat protein